MKFLDYCFYRLYTSFKKKDDIGLVPAIVYMSLTEFMLSIPFVFYFTDVLKENGCQSYVKTFVLSSCLFVFIINTYIYAIKGRLKKIVVEFENFKYNKSIKSFWFFLLFPLSTIIGFWIYFLIKNLNLIM